MKVEVEQIGKDIPESAKLWLHEETESTRRLVQFMEKEKFRVMVLSCYKEEQIYQIKFGDIDFIESICEVQYIHAEGEIYCTRKRLYELEGILPPEFVRASKSVLLNMVKVKQYSPLAGGMMMAEFANGECTYISRKYLKALRAKIKEGLL